MSLSANNIIQRKQQPVIKKKKVVDGAIHIYKGAHLAYEGGNIGYVMLASDVTLNEYAGIALEELNLAAADNTSDGTFEVEILQRGCGQEVLLDITSAISIANEDDPVYMDGDDAVDISSGISHSTTFGLVGIIREFVSANKAWVQMVQHPTL